MRGGRVRCLAVLVVLFLVPVVGLCLESRDLIRLKQAGLAEETLQLLIREKTIETNAFSVDDILALKKAGISEATLRLLITEHSFLKDRSPVIYGQGLKSIQYTTILDIVRLKEAGFSDGLIQAVVQAVRDDDAHEREKAWRMLESMGIVVDMRDGGRRR